MTYFVYYSDGYADDGDVGLTICDTQLEVESFITERIKQDPKRTLEMYMVIKGERIELKTVSVITQVKLC